LGPAANPIEPLIEIRFGEYVRNETEGHQVDLAALEQRTHARKTPQAAGCLDPAGRRGL
jgi:hypothetical protein